MVADAAWRSDDPAKEAGAVRGAVAGGRFSTRLTDRSQLSDSKTHRCAFELVVDDQAGDVDLLERTWWCGKMKREVDTRRFGGRVQRGS